MSANLISNEQLEEIVKAEAAKHGFTDADARFVSIAEFKVRWTRSDKWISMDFSDYLRVISLTALKDLVAETLRGIKTGGKPQYGAALRRSVGAKKFLKANQDKHLTRLKLCHHTEYENVPSLYEAYRRVIDKGLLEHDPDFRMAWKAWPVAEMPFKASGVFKTAVFNTSLFMDAEGGPVKTDDDCLDYLVYCAALQAGRLLPTEEEVEEMKVLAESYPGRGAILAKLDAMGINGRVFE